MGVVRFCIVFDKANKVYHPGEMVTGRVELVLNSMMKIGGVELRLGGRAKCWWHEDKTWHDTEGEKHTRTVNRNSDEVYFQNEQILNGGRGKLELSAGEYSYPFAVMLPIKAPSSFKGTYGGISYYAKAKIYIPFTKDKEERTEFTVVNLLDLNLYQHLRTPYKDEKSKTFCCLCCASGPLTIAVHLPKTGFALSESIPITLEIDNASNVAVNAVHVYLKREIRWTADGHHKHEDLELRNLRLGEVKEGQSHTWSVKFTIPRTSYPNLDCCSLIAIDHKLHIEADPSGMHLDLNMHIPITIGDIALSKDPNAPIVTPQVQTYPNNMADNSGMQMPTGVPMNPVPSPYSNQNPQTANYPYPANITGAPFGVPPPQSYPPAPLGHVVSQPVTNNASSNLGFVAPVPHLYMGGMPQIPTQGYPQQNYSAGVYPPPGNYVSAQLCPPQVLPTLVTNPQSSQNAPNFTFSYTSTGNGSTHPSFQRNVQLEKTSFLNDSSPSAPPPS